MSKAFFWISIQLLILVTAKRNFRFVGTKAECHNKLPEAFESFGCFIDQCNNRTFGSGHFIFRVPMTQLITKIEVHTKVMSGRRTNLINLRVDLCAVLEGIKKDKVFKIGTKILKRFMNVVPRCPLKAHFNYTLSKAYFDEEDFPQYTPLGDFTLKMSFFNKSTEGAVFMFFGRVVSA